MAKSNTYDTREAWLRAATNELRAYFDECRYQLPHNIRFAIAFTSTGRKGKRVGECWHSSTSRDTSYEIFIRADLDEPVDVLSVLVKELVHTLLPIDAGHGKLFKAAALKIGLQGPMRKALPGPLLHDRLKALADSLGFLPHARLDISKKSMTARAVAVDAPKKQRARMLKAECAECAKGDKPYIVRLAAAAAREIGPPICPRHGEALYVEFPAEAEELPEPGPDCGELREAV